MENQKFPISIYLDNIRSALNVGAIFRTCDASAIDTLYLGGITPYPPHNKIPKTALGAIDQVNWQHSRDGIDILKNIKNSGGKIYSIELTEESENIFSYEVSFPCTLVFGHEINGVSKEILDISDKILYIPMYGKKESLNVATTCGIAIYEVLRKLIYK